MMKTKIISILAFAFMLSLPTPSVWAGSGEVTFIHIGDLHGHLIPRVNMRKDDPTYGKEVGGLAYVYDQIEKIRERHPNALLVNTGDTIQGGAEALYSRGQSMVDILNTFKIDAFAAGNWDFLYGTNRFRELFAGDKPLADWGAVAANLYYATLYELPDTPYADKAGQRVLPPYMLQQIGDVKVGIIGLTADRGPQAVSHLVMHGFSMTPGEDELRWAVPILKDKHKVDLIVLISERGLAANLELVETIPGVDIVLSSDMHEETWREIVSKNGVVLVEEGQDGTMVGELTVKVENGKMVDHQFMAHRVSVENNKPHPDIQKKIDEIRKPFVKGTDFKAHVNPINASVLRTPIDSVIGYTKKPLHRSNFSDASEMHAVIEGSSHNFLADAFKHGCDSDLGMIRGFRYGTHIAPGPIKLEDIYHYLPIGPQIGCGKISGDDIRLMLERGADKSLSQYVGWWGGGWLIAFSGLTYDLDPNNEFGLRVSNLRVNGDPIDLQKYYSVAGYWYLDLPGKLNRTKMLDVKVLRSPDNQTVDATEVVAWYLNSLPNHTADTKINRIRLLDKLPEPISINKEMQPLKGVARPDY